MIQKTNGPKEVKETKSGTSNLLLGMGFGLVIGLGIALVAAYLIEKNPPIEKLNSRAPDIALVPKVAEDGTVTNEAADPNTTLQGKQKKPEIATDTSVAASPVDIPPPPTPAATTENPSGTSFFIQAGSFNDKSAAESSKAQLAMQGMQAKISEFKKDDKTTSWRVRLGPYGNPQEMVDDKNNLDNAGIAFSVIKVNK
jgi:cell division protein FtsN